MSDETIRPNCRAPSACAARGRGLHCQRCRLPSQIGVVRDDGAYAFPVTLGFVTLIDPDLAPLVLGRRWYAHMSRHGPYARAKWEDGQVYLHRFIADAPPELHVDHINGDRLDNRRANLRVCTAAENNRNCSKQRSGGAPYKGLTARGNKWEASICLDRTTHNLGTFADPTQAALAYDAAARRLHGEFARLNFPDHHGETA